MKDSLLPAYPLRWYRVPTEIKRRAAMLSYRIGIKKAAYIYGLHYTTLSGYRQTRW